MMPTGDDGLRAAHAGHDFRGIGPAMRPQAVPPLARQSLAVDGVDGNWHSGRQLVSVVRRHSPGLTRVSNLSTEIGASGRTAASKAFGKNFSSNLRSIMVDLKEASPWLGFAGCILLVLLPIALWR